MGSLAHLKQRAMFGRAYVVAVLIFVIKIPVVFTHSARGCKLCFLPFNPVFPSCFCFPSTLPCCLAKCLGHPAGRSQWSVFTFRVGSHSVSPSPGEHQTAMWNGLAFSRAWGKQKSKTKQKRKKHQRSKISISECCVCEYIDDTWKICERPSDSSWTGGVLLSKHFGDQGWQYPEASLPCAFRSTVYDKTITNRDSPLNWNQFVLKTNPTEVGFLPYTCPELDLWTTILIFKVLS